jgi:hypothetical protein
MVAAWRSFSGLGALFLSLLYVNRFARFKPKIKQKTRHRTRRFLLLRQTDRVLDPENRSLQKPKKPQQIVG